MARIVQKKKKRSGTVALYRCTCFESFLCEYSSDLSLTYLIGHCVVAQSFCTEICENFVIHKQPTYGSFDSFFFFWILKKRERDTISLK